MAYATFEDVQNRYHEPLDETDETLVMMINTRLADAELLILSRIPDLVAQVDEGTIHEATLVMVEAEMVLRLIKNPEGYSQESDGNYSYAIYQQVASGKLEVLDNEWDLLGVRAGAAVLQPWLAPAGPNFPPADPSMAWQINIPWWYPVGQPGDAIGWYPW